MGKVNVNELSIGNIIEHDNSIWSLVKKEHVKPGKGGAFLQVELKNVKIGTKLNTRFRSSEAVEVLMSESMNYNVLYKTDSEVIFMNSNGDQIEMTFEQIGDNVVFLEDGLEIKINFIDGSPVGITLPETVSLKVIETQAYIKGQTVTGTFKPATLENGINVQVPQFIEPEDMIVIKTEDRIYISKA